MKPILYGSVTEGTVPISYGVGVLTDCISCEVKEERNGAYELELEYAAEGIHAADITPNSLIKAKPNFTDDPQLFRIYKVGKTINGKFKVSAQHISYDLSGKIITTGSASSCVAACALLEASAGNFTINTDKTVSADFSVSEPSSVRSWFGGKRGSLLDVYGGEWHYNNYVASLKQARGADRGVQIRYGKNLTELSQEISMENLCTGVIPFYIDQDGNKTVGAKVLTGLTLDVDKDIAIDFSQDVKPDNGTPIATQLATLAANYISKNILTTMLNSITLDFVQLSNLQERVDLCDTVGVYVEALGISASMKCVATVWDVLKERYTSTTFGTARSNIADTIATQQQEVAQTASRSYLAEAVKHATGMITGNLGGYVILHDANNDGEPDEILIMDTDDISTATKVWRWNKNGLGYSSTGYSGSYDLAMTSDGEIVADFITTGTLTADLIKAGVIEDIAHNSSIDMTNGIARLKNLVAKNKFVHEDESGVERTIIDYNIATGTSLIFRDANAVTQAILYAAPANGGNLELRDTSGKLSVFAFNRSDGKGGTVRVHSLAGNNNALAGMTVETNGGYIWANNNSNNTAVNMNSQSHGGGIVSVRGPNGDLAGSFYGTSTSYGALLLNDTGGNTTIFLRGDNGDVTCVSCTQTSSRKVKENIKPIEDASKILELEAVSFDFKNKDLGINRRGFIAEDVAEILPNLVKPETEETPASLNYVEMIPYLQAVIKEQDKRIKALEDKISKLGG